MNNRRNLHDFIVSGLSQYLQIHEAHRLNPALSKQKLNNPLVVVGLPRSGTTHLHRLLASAPDSVSMPMWESFRPVPPRKGFDLRRLIMKVEFFFWKVCTINQMWIKVRHILWMWRKPYWNICVVMFCALSTLQITSGSILCITFVRTCQMNVSLRCASVVRLFYFKSCE